MFCPNCGNQINDNATFCPNCGNKIEVKNKYIHLFKKNVFKFLIPIGIVFVLFIFINIKSNSKNDNVDKNNSKKTDELDEAFSVGNEVIFGRWNDEDIEWVIIGRNKNKGHALLLSKYIIDYKPFNEKWEITTYENCTLRKWLTGDFYNNAFNGDEKSKIVKTHLNNSQKFEYKTYGGNDTYDYVWILSEKNLDKYLPNINDRFTKKMPNYKNNAWEYGVSIKDEYWIRNITETPMTDGSYEAYVTDKGEDIDGISLAAVDDLSYGVRPVLWYKYR